MKIHVDAKHKGFIVKTLEITTSKFGEFGICTSEPDGNLLHFVVQVSPRRGADTKA